MKKERKNLHKVQVDAMIGGMAKKVDTSPTLIEVLEKANPPFRWVNCTPHDIILLRPSGELWRKIPPSGQVIRLQEHRKKLASLDGITIAKKTYTTGGAALPPKSWGTLYIVSLLVAQSFPDRDDFVVPDTIRDASGKITGCSGFCVVGGGA